MFAHIFLPRQRPHYQGKQTYISVAISLTLSCFALSTQAATAEVSTAAKTSPSLVDIDAANSETAQIAYEGLGNPDMPMEDTPTVSRAFIAQQARLFFECTQVQTDSARLVCFDKVAEQGKTPSYVTTKQPLDLAKTFKKTISGNPQVVLVEDETSSDSEAGDSNEAVLLSNQPQMKSSLDKRRVDKDEAQILEEIGVTQQELEKFTSLSLAYDLDKNSERGIWTVRPYRATYLMPLFYTFEPNLGPNTPSQETESYTSNDIRNTELKFQLSLKSKVAEDLFGTNADLWFGYTQESHWQVYNEDNSRPFRATDYQPEIFLTQPVRADLPFGGRLRMLGAGAIHHSNGQDDPTSRSWNRAYLMAGAEWGKLSVIPRLWARVKNESSSSEDNPDIEDFMGYGDVKFLYDLPNEQSLSSTLRYNPGTNKGAVQVDYTYPLSKNVNGFVQLFQGYGESIIDYNHENTSIGFGIVLNDWKGL